MVDVEVCETQTLHAREDDPGAPTERTEQKKTGRPGANRTQSRTMNSGSETEGGGLSFTKDVQQA